MFTEDIPNFFSLSVIKRGHNLTMTAILSHTSNGNPQVCQKSGNWHRP